jgi:uncharacterized protein with HEPN domain
MFDRELVLEILEQILEASQRVLKRFEPIRSVDDFTNSESGMEKLDAICMQLVAIGEGLKNLDKITENELLARYPEIEWKKIKGMRDIISHHYFDVDAEVIFDVCENHCMTLKETIHKMIIDLGEKWGLNK